jgi:hypothetical protein
MKICQILNPGGLQGHNIKHFATGVSALKTTEILIRLLLGMQERRCGFYKNSPEVSSLYEAGQAIN